MSSMKKFQNILVTLNKLDLANRGQRLGPTSTCHHRLVFVHLRETGTITISGSLQNAWNILRSDIVFVSVFYIKVIQLLICDNLKPAQAACRLLGFTIAISGDSFYSFSINFNVKISSTYLYYVHDSAIPTYLLFYKCNSLSVNFYKVSGRNCS